ncbi:MAG: hypothetical protein H6724_04900 [Sandaracinus sp.]|nr:hypothetical protein [Sandaracinus sp.]MCB9618776.1 hypothetical protein [Sandaracinus sp.]
MSYRFALVALVAFASLGCRAELGECDEAAARQVVFRITPSGEVTDEAVAGSIEDGTPLYAGQALMQVHCGNGGFCHAPAATGNGRAGAPRGLDFDLSLACRPTDNCCSEAACDDYARRVCMGDPDPDCAQNTYDAEIERVTSARVRLSDNQHEAYEHRYDILRTVEDGSMPPGAAGEGVRANAVYYGAFDGASFMGPVPSLDTKEGREVFRNWLSCGSPVLEFAVAPDADNTPGDSCGAGTVGECAVAAPSLAPPDPNWNSIYEGVVRPLCLECHQPDNPFWGPDDQELDYREEAASLTAMRGIDAEASECGGTGTLIVPGDAASSIFYTKLTSEPGCGDIMPLGRESGLPEAVLAPIRQWINDGANP